MFGNAPIPTLSPGPSPLAPVGQSDDQLFWEEFEADLTAACGTRFNYSMTRTSERRESFAVNLQRSDFIDDDRDHDDDGCLITVQGGDLRSALNDALAWIDSQSARLDARPQRAAATEKGFS